MRLLLVYLFIPWNLWAYVSFGSYTPALFKYQVNALGQTKLLDLNFMVGVHFTSPPLPYLPNHYARPELGFIFDSSEIDDEYGRLTTYILYDLAWEFKKNFFLRYGVGTFVDRIMGPGGTKLQKNGSSIATFYRPSLDIASYTSSINLGFEYQLSYDGKPLESKSYRPMLRFETHTFAPLNPKRRAFAFSLNMLFVAKQGSPL